MLSTNFKVLKFHNIEQPIKSKSQQQVPLKQFSGAHSECVTIIRIPNVLR